MGCRREFLVFSQASCGFCKKRPKKKVKSLPDGRQGKSKKCIPTFAKAMVGRESTIERKFE